MSWRTLAFVTKKQRVVNGLETLHPVRMVKRRLFPAYLVFELQKSMSPTRSAVPAVAGLFGSPKLSHFAENEAQKMRETSIQIDRVTKELRALLVQLHWSAFQGFNPGDQNLILNELLNAGLIEDLRTTVDQLSQFLWCYVESAAQTTSNSELDYETQSKHLEKITQMLRVLHRPASPVEDPLAFVERLTKSVDRHLETASHNPGKAAASPSHSTGKPAAAPSPQAEEPGQLKEIVSEPPDSEDGVVNIRTAAPRFGSGQIAGGRLSPISWR